MTLSTIDELDERRVQVMRLRHRRMSETAIARMLNVSHSTVSRDLSWIRQHWRDLLGANATFDSDVFIGESLAAYEDIESQAMFDSAKAGISTRDKMRCLHTAMNAREKQVQILLDTGVVSRTPVPANLNLPTADQIRRGLKAAAINLETPQIIDIASRSSRDAGSSLRADRERLSR